MSLTFSGAQDFRIKLVLATLAGRPVKITGIRSDDLEPGLRDYEVSFLRLLELVTNGSVIEISYTGTTVIYKPGLIIGGTHTFNCPLNRGMGYFIEPLLLLAPFGKKSLVLTMHGITSSHNDLGVDTIRTSLFPVFEKFGISRQELRIVKRGAVPQGGGEVVLSLPHLVLQPNTLHVTSTPKISKIRGIAYSTRINPSSVNRTIDSARQVLKDTKVETYIYSDVARGDESGKSPGFGITIVAETKSGWNISSEGVVEAGTTPEELGQQVACKLLEEISIGGAVGRNQLWLVLILMILGKEDIGRVSIGKKALDERIVRLLRYIKTIWNTQVVFSEENDQELICAVKGVGYVSASKKIA